MMQYDEVSIKEIHINRYSGRQKFWDTFKMCECHCIRSGVSNYRIRYNIKYYITIVIQLLSIIN